MPPESHPHPITRREAIRLGASIATATALGSSLANQRLAAQGNSNAARATRVFDVANYGATGDGVTPDTAAIQRAIDEAAAAAATAGASSSSGASGPARAQVLVRGGRRYLVGTLQLRSGIDFHLADDALLVASTDRSHYSERGAVLTAHEAQGLSISGTGWIDGRALEFMTHYDKTDEWWRPKGWRPRLFELTACRDLEVRDISFRDAPSWGLHMIGCERVLIDNLTIKNQLEVPNCDGIDPDHCRDMEIRNCHITCGDDAIVLKTTRQGAAYGPCANIVVKDCVIETQDSGVKIGTETTQDIHNIVFERCKIITSCRGLTIQLRDAGNVRDVEFRDITFVSRYFSDPWWGRGEAISLTAIPRNAETKVGTISGVRVRNVTGRAENSVRVSGCPQSRVRDVTFENVAVTLDRWTKYPGGLFDNRPTTADVFPAIEPHGNPGFSLRHADNVTLDRCRVAWGENRPDYFTHALESHDVSGLELKEFSGEAAHPDRYVAIARS